MAGEILTSPSVVFNDVAFGGGLNSTGGPLSLTNQESSDLQNIDFNKFGSIKQRSGYEELNATQIGASVESDGLYWFEFVSGSSVIRKLVNVSNGAFYKMDDLDGTWDDATNGQTITAGNPADFASLTNQMIITNGNDLPLVWDGAGTASLTTMTVPTGLTNAKYCETFENYMFLANVIVSGTAYKSRVYFSNIGDLTTWTATDFIDISPDDGQEITRIQTLGRNLIIFKERSIYFLQFTGDADIPFVRRRTNSPVGNIAPYSVQEVNNGLVFLSYDGFYFFDGNNSFKISEKVTTTLGTFATQAFENARSLVQRDKNRYWCALPSSGQTVPDRVMVWDFFLNAWSFYTGMTITSATTVYVDGIEERPYFSDDEGYTYRADFGLHDSPEKVDTAIDAYYYTNWRHYSDLIHNKAVPQIVIYFQTSESSLTFSYTYDFQVGDQYTQTFSISGGGDVYGVGRYGTARYAQEGGRLSRRALAGQGRLIRFKFENSTIDETFQIDGLGQKVYADTDK